MSKPIEGSPGHVSSASVLSSTATRAECDFALGLWRDYQDARDFALDAPVKKKLRFVLENNVYDVNTAELVWTVQSYSPHPKSADEIIEPLTRLLTEQLKKDNLI